MERKVRVLVVDDSGYVISVITRRLGIDPDIEVIGSARNGIEAIEKVKSLKPDVVTMDIIMPEMDGITALEKIMAECPTPVIMLSALTSENAAPTIRALELGAVDFYLKPSSLRPVGMRVNDDSLTAKIKAAAMSHITGREKLLTGITPLKKEKSALKSDAFKNLVVIGTSTGGPRALMQVIPALPADIPAAVLVVQHMPPMFTKTLAERLNQASEVDVAEARDGTVIRKGTVLMAPGDFHMAVDENGKISLNQEPTVLGVRPAVDWTMKSAADVYGAAVLGVILTGMGTDGTEGASRIKASGGRILAQDEATSAVYGMPQSVFKAGCVDKVFPLQGIANGIVEACLN